MSAIGGRDPEGRRIVAFNLGIPESYSSKTKDIFFDPDPQLGGDSQLIRKRINPFSQWGGISINDADDLLRDVIGIDPDSRLGQLVKTGSIDELDEILEHLYELEAELGALEDKAGAVIEKWIGEQKRKLREKITGTAAEEWLESASRSLDSLEQELKDAYTKVQDTAGNVAQEAESYLDQYLKLENQCQ